MITAGQLVAHGVGDYILQSDWMAGKKTAKVLPALAHVVTYTLAFLPLTTSWQALLFILGTHFIIDHWRLARYVVWAKNFLAPKSDWPPPWEKCTATGYAPDRLPWLATWLMIIADNLMHVLCNGWAIYYWGSK